MSFAMLLTGKFTVIIGLTKPSIIFDNSHQKPTHFLYHNFRSGLFELAFIRLLRQYFFSNLPQFQGWVKLQSLWFSHSKRHGREKTTTTWHKMNKLNCLQKSKTSKHKQFWLISFPQGFKRLYLTFQHFNWFQPDRLSCTFKEKVNEI